MGKEISILVSMSQFYEGPALRIAFSAAEILRREYGIHAFVEVDNTTVTNPHSNLIQYWSAAVMVNDRVVYVDYGDSVDPEEGVDQIVRAVLGGVSRLDVAGELSIAERNLKPTALPGELL